MSKSLARARRGLRVVLLPLHDHDRNRHDDRIRSFVIRHDAPIAWDAFVDWIEALIATHGANLLRMKGILYVAEVDGPVAVHGNPSWHISCKLACAE